MSDYNFFDKKIAEIDNNFVDVDAADLFDEEAARKASQSDAAPSKRQLERQRRANPFEAIRRAGMHNGEDFGGAWLLGGPPPGQRPLLTEYGQCIFTGEHKNILYMPLGKVGLLAAPGGSGKTTILMQLAASVASGLPWLGHYDVAKPGRVLVVMGEEDEDNIDLLVWKAARAVVGPLESEEKKHEAVHAIAKNLHTWSVTGLRVGIEYKGPDGNNGESYGAFHDSLIEYLDNSNAEWSLIIIDPAARFFPSEAETDNAQATRFIESLEVLTEVNGNPAVIFAHHSGKEVRKRLAPSANDARGSSAFVDGGRWMGVITVHPIPGASMTVLSVEKSNYGPLTLRALKRASWSEGGGFRAASEQETESIRIEAKIAELREEERQKGIEEQARMALGLPPKGSKKSTNPTKKDEPAKADAGEFI